MSGGTGDGGQPAWDRVARLPARQVAERLGLEYEGPCPGGEVGVDWDGAGRGDRRLDLVTLRYDLELRASALAAELDAHLRTTVPADVLRLCWAHMGIRLVDWAIRHNGPADVERWLRVAKGGYEL